MQEELINFETAKLAKEKGFNWTPKYLINVYDKEDKNLVLLKIVDYYKNTDICILAPTQSILQKWIKEVHNIIVLVDITKGFSQNYRWKYFKVEVTKNHKRIIECIDDIHYETYEEALEVGLQEGLKLI
jgi:hypothetical protein